MHCRFQCVFSGLKQLEGKHLEIKPIPLTHVLHQPTFNLLAVKLKFPRRYVAAHWIAVSCSSASYCSGEGNPYNDHDAMTAAVNAVHCTGCSSSSTAVAASAAAASNYAPAEAAEALQHSQCTAANCTAVNCTAGR